MKAWVSFNRLLFEKDPRVLWREVELPFYLGRKSFQFMKLEQGQEILVSRILNQSAN